MTLQSEGKSRVLISLSLALVVCTVFGFSSYASPDVPTTTTREVVQESSASLTIRSGSVHVNGNVAQSGQTILTGSILNTSSDGNAIVDFGAAGKVEIGSGTTVTLTCVGGLLQVRTNCSETKVKCYSGSVNVFQPKTEVLAPGDNHDYDGAVEATGGPGAAWFVACQTDPKAAMIGPGLIGLLALIGVGAGVAIGVAAGDDDEGVPSSPTL